MAPWADRVVREYSAAAVLTLAVATVVAASRGSFRERATWFGLGIFTLLTIIADVILTHIGVFTYSAWAQSGIRIDRMPIEDLAYGLALYLTAITVWNWDRR